MRRVLIVSPHFAPVNTADMQRVRLLLPWLRQFGWEPTVLAVAPESIEGAVLEPLLEKTYPSDIRVLRVRGISPKLTRRFGIGSLWLRCGRALRKAGDKLLRKEAFDLVFFSTTVFGSFSLGPRWLKDYHDPWVTDYYQTTGNAPPGGKLKYAFSQWQARRLEPHIVANAAAIISVSNFYGPSLCARYPRLQPSNIHHIPFGTEPGDIELAKANPPKRSLLPQGEGLINLVYTGRVVEGMEYSLTLLFQAFSLYKKSHPQEAEKIRFHFIGTDYSPPPLGRNWVIPVAERENIGQYVTEHCYRVPYFEALYYLSRADALIILGSDEPSYSASKIFPYLFTKKPLITVAHQDSIMLQITKEQEIASSYGFTLPLREEERGKLVERIYNEWFIKEGYQQYPTKSQERLKPYCVSDMTSRISTALEQAVRTPEA